MMTPPHSATFQESLLEKIINVAQGVMRMTRSSLDANKLSLTSCPVFELPRFPPPEPLTFDLLGLGVPKEIAERISMSYMDKGNCLKSTSETKVRETCAKLAHIPGQTATHLEDLQQQLHSTFCQNYLSTLDTWRKDALNLARSRMSPPEKSQSASAMKGKPPFKTEFLPLFEFAFSKDRFPNREDKKRLAQISGMSFHQITVWFQNRRCRGARSSRARSLTPSCSVPQTLEEVKLLLSPSARESINVFGLSSNPNSPLYSHIGKQRREDTVKTMPASISGSIVERSSPPVDDILPPQTSIPDDDEYDSDLFGDEDSESENSRLLQQESRSVSPNSATFAPPASAVPSPSPSPTPTISRPETPAATASSSSNPLNASSSSLPAPYEPSKLTSNPFVVEQTPWLRHPLKRRTRTADPTPEPMENILASLKSMDVQMEWAPTKDRRPQKPLPRRARKAACLPALSSIGSSCVTPVARTLPSLPSSSALSSGYSSSLDESSSSCPSSRSCSFSSIASSRVPSTPQLSELDLPTGANDDEDSDVDDSIFAFSVSKRARYMAGSVEEPAKSVNDAPSTMPPATVRSSTAWEQLVTAATTVEVVK